MKSRQHRSDARSLRQRAGRASRYETHFEALEERKLLFSISITPDMDLDGDGLGTVSARFGYTIPYLDSEPEVAQGDPEAIDEDLNDDPTGSVGSGALLLESNIRVTHSFGFNANFRIAAPNFLEPDERLLDINATNGSFWQFEPYVVDDDTGTLIANIAAIEGSFTVGGGDDNVGLSPNLFFVDLLLFGEVTATYTGDQLIARNTSGNIDERNNGVGTFVFDADDTVQQAFTGIRIRSATGENLTIDNLQFLTAPGLFADIIEERIFGAEITFTAPIGATVTILDLYGREMRQTLALGKPDQLEINLVDANDDGVSDFNDGIGRISFSGVDSRATFTLFGGEITFDTDNGFEFTRVDSFTGIYDDFEGAGFGYQVEYDDGGTPTVYGLPAGPGSVIVGSPFVRDNTDSGSYNPAGLAGGQTVVTGDFNRTDQGVFVTTGESMGAVYIHGVVHGSSRFTGAVEELYFGYLAGSVTVDGDLGSLYVGSEAGFWVSDDDATTANTISTGSEVTVGRTLGEFSVAGRSAISVTVRGDLDSPSLRPPGDTYRYTELEKIYAYDEAENDEDFIIGGIQFPISDLFGDLNGLFSLPGGRSPIYVDSTFRNDTIAGAEFVGGISSAAEISGSIGYGDPINGEDPADVYAFIADGLQQVNIQINTLGSLGYVRVVDQNGVPVAATVLEDASFGATAGVFSQNIRFLPPRPGVYYLELTDLGVNDVDGQNTSGWAYLVTMTGLTPVTFGSYRTGGSTGIGDLVPTVQTLTGSMGVIRTGVGYLDAGGQDASSVAIMNRAGDEDGPFDVVGTRFVSAGDMYAFVAGSDVILLDIFVDGDLGGFYTGMSPVFGLTGDGLEGDISGTFLQVSGRIGTIDIKGAVGIDNDPDEIVFIGGVGFDIRTGLGGGDGSIGSIYIGGDVNGDALTINTSPGSVIGTLLISQDRGDEGLGIYNRLFQGTTISLGAGSDIRFVDFPRIDNLNSVDQSFELRVGQSVEFVDDAGGIFLIEIQGPISGMLAGSVRVLPLDDGQGVAIARIDGVDLTGGRTLRITSTGIAFGGADDAPISIGGINIVAADAQSGIEITGNVEIDVWKITSAAALNRITNDTPNGDIVAIDVAGLAELLISDGNLGSTEGGLYGGQNYGVFLGIAATEQTDVGGALGVSAAAMIRDTGAADGFRPVGNIADVYLEDIGAPLDPYLNGVVVRGGNINNVIVSGSIGDVILQGGGTIQNIVADSDFIAGVGQLDGIFGNIYAQVIDTVDVGQGLLSSAIAPFTSSGIFGTDEIRVIDVDALRHEGAFLSGVVVASNIVPLSGPPGNLDVGGIGEINIDNGEIRDAYIGSMNIDAFLSSYLPIGEVFGGTIGRIGGTDLTIFRSRIEATDLTDLSLGQGTYDATVTSVRRNIGNIDLRVARNSTIGGGEFEFGFNRINVGGNIASFEGGQVSDLRVEALGRVTGTVMSDNWRRVEFIVNGSVPNIEIADTMVGTKVSVGQLGDLSAQAIRTSQISVSGELTSVMSDTEIYNTTIEVTGAQGEIGSITAPDRIVGSISATGPIGSITATAGDLDISVTTTTVRGTVDEISAARDLVIESSISAGLGSITAGRNIGRSGEAGLIFVKGDLTSVNAGGHLYTDIRVGGTLDSAVIGRAVNRPGQPMGLSGSFYVAEAIQSIAITGDFGGSIVSYTSGIQSVTITDGSILSTGGLSAFNGNIESLVITGGNLYGDLFTDRSIVSVVIEPSADGVFGDVGVNPSFSAGTGYDAFRGQLPPGVQQTAGKDGPTIVAMVDIESFVVSGGSIYEATLFAGQTLRSLDVTGRIIADFTPGNTGRSIIAAGDEITNISVSSNINRAVILAGVRSLGDDLDAGGFGNDADTMQSGRIVGISVGGNLTNTQIAAGTNAGSDRDYNTADDLLEIGISSVGAISIAGAATGSSVFSDRLLPGSRAGGKLAWGGPFRPVNNSDIATSTTGTQLTRGANFTFSTAAGEGTILFTGPGRAFFDASTSRVILTDTTAASNLLVRANGDRNLTDFDIVSTEGASVGRIRVEAFRLLGDSDIVIDENIDRLELGQIMGTGTIQAGATLTSFISGNFRSGELIARDAGSVVVSGEFGDADTGIRGEVIMSFGSLTSARFNGLMSGDLSVRYGLETVNAPAGISGGLIRAGERIGAISTTELSRTRISAGRSLDSLDVTGNMFDSAVLVGGDLGDDAEIGGTGFNSDQVAAGTIGTITIGGDFVVSDIVAGYLRGPDGFFGTPDDLLSSGRSTIGAVTIGGEALGSNAFSESYRIASTGTLGDITAGGVPLTSEGNLVVEIDALEPLPIQITSVQIDRQSGLYVAELAFNQPIDFSSLDRALSVSEVRGVGEIEIRLIQGVDFTLDYNSNTDTVSVFFSRSLIEQDLPIVGDRPGPGVYRFEIESQFMRGAAAQAGLDGDGNGRIDAADNFASQNIVGDAGDKFAPESFTIAGRNGLPDSRVDLYGPTNLDIVLDDANRPDGLPDANIEFTIRGAIGDNPDHDVDFFSFSSDSDIYSITLQAGQILRLGAMQGPAQLTGRFLVQPDGSILFGSTDFGLALPVEPITSENRDFTLPEDFLIRQTATYFILIGNSVQGVLPGVLPDLPPINGGVGEYDFTITVFDDGDSGFNANTNAGDGQDLVNAPAPSAFAGNDNTLGTADDRRTIVIGAYTFTFSAGPDGVAGTTDDFVSGSNGTNVSSLTDALGTQMVSVEAAIGQPGFSGVPKNFVPDVDVFNLNNGNPINAGTVIKATLALSDLGSDLGSFVGTLNDPFLIDSFVQFAIFDTTNSTGADDALLLYAPSDVSPTGGETGILAESNNVTYGFDENGDFYIEFVAPGRFDVPGAAAKYAIYVQGVLNTDYRLEVVTGGSRETVQRRQNFFLETNGGNVDWLEVNNQVTPVRGFDAGTLGFTGRAENGQPIDEFIIDRVAAVVQGTFDGVVTGAGGDGVFGTADDERGLDVNVSSNSADFDFQDYSTIFISSMFDPRKPVFSVSFLDVFGQTYGAAQHADPGNADRTDDAIVFIPNLSTLDYTPSSADLESFVQSLAAVTTRRAGELMGLRLTEAYDPTLDVFDAQAVNSVEDIPSGTGGYELLREDRRLSPSGDAISDSDFFLGYQNAAGLLSLYTRSS